MIAPSSCRLSFLLSKLALFGLEFKGFTLKIYFCGVCVSLLLPEYYKENLSNSDKVCRTKLERGKDCMTMLGSCVKGKVSNRVDEAGNYTWLPEDLMA